MLPPLSVERAVTTWQLDLPVTVAALAVTALYLAAARRRTDWSAARTGSFLGAVATLVLLRSSFFAVYDHALFWPLAVQDVLLVTVVPLPLALGRPFELLPRAPRLAIPPMLGSLVAMTTLIALYVTGWDQARLEHDWLFRATQVVLLGAGLAFLGPLLGDGPTGYGRRTLVAFADGLLDAMPGLAILAGHGTIAAAYYAVHHPVWAPTLAKDQQIGGTAMIALSELVGLPALLVLLVQWVRADAGTAAVIDAELDAVAAAEAAAHGVEPTELERPWWETDAGPLAGRLRKPD